eukprot:g32445.t1
MSWSYYVLNLSTLALLGWGCFVVYLIVGSRCGKCSQEWIWALAWVATGFFVCFFFANLLWFIFFLARHLLRFLWFQRFLRRQANGLDYWLGGFPLVTFLTDTFLLRDRTDQGDLSEIVRQRARRKLRQDRDKLKKRLKEIEDELQDADAFL